MSLFTWKTSYNMNKRYVEKFQFFVLKFFKNLWKEFIENSFRDINKICYLLLV